MRGLPVISVLDFPGRYDDGVLCVMCLTWSDLHGESVLYYKKDELMFVPSKEITDVTGPLENFTWYEELVEKSLSLCPPYDEICHHVQELKDI